MLTLGIESSCDETAIALVEDGRTVLCSLISSQIKVHEKFGGVVPEVASREHLLAIKPLFDEALKSTGVPSFDLIAVTQGPGLIGSLLVGVSFAKGLALSSSKPLIPVNHVHAHIHGALLNRGDQDLFPSLCLVVSGGHTNLYYAKSASEFSLLCFSLDDACGESFDKVAKLLGLGFPGGPAIEKLARIGNPKRFAMPLMMKGALDFSYSGLKTHVMYALKKGLTPEDFPDLCASFQEEAFRQITAKISLAKEKIPRVKSMIIAGGVSANLRFQELMNLHFQKEGMKIIYPELRFCGDNAAMIASLGHDLYQTRIPSSALHSWDAFSRYDFRVDHTAIK